MHCLSIYSIYKARVDSGKGAALTGRATRGYSGLLGATAPCPATWYGRASNTLQYNPPEDLAIESDAWSSYINARPNPRATYKAQGIIIHTWAVGLKDKYKVGGDYDKPPGFQGWNAGLCWFL